jgi:hypothetical protein
MFFLEFPDIESMLGEGGAAEENIRQKLEALKKAPLSDKQMPHPYMNLALAKTLTSDAINQAEVDGLSPDVVNRLTEFWELVDEEEKIAMAKKAQAMAGIPPGPGGPPGGMPAQMPGEVPSAVPAGPLPGMGIAA